MSTSTHSPGPRAALFGVARERELVDAAIAVGEARSLDEAFQALAETGRTLLGCERLSVVAWNDDLSLGTVRADTAQAVGSRVPATSGLAEAIRAGTEPARSGRLVRVQRVTGAGIATFDALWDEALDDDEAEAAAELLGVLTRLISIAERSVGAADRRVNDVSEKRRLDQQLVQSGKLAAIGELAAGVAHEINNPLFAILGLTEFLLKEAEPASKAEQRLLLIQQTGLEIKEIVRALLDFARENAEERHVVALDDVVRSTVDLVRRTNAHKAIEIVDTYCNDGALVSASPNQLKQIFLNLIANARQAMPNGGSVRIQVHRDGGHVIAVVSDDGPGIDPGTLERIFEPFFTTKRLTGGTGLGLSVSLGIAESHGGTLTAASERGHGAAFTLRLPIAEGDCA